MRPHTLSEAYERIVSGEPREKALPEFLDTFYGLEPGEREATLADAPPSTGDTRLDALAGAIAEYLSKQNGLRPPSWSLAQSRYLGKPWFTTDLPGAEIKAFLWHCSPAEFRSRNIFTEARPLMRAAQG